MERKCKALEKGEGGSLEMRAKSLEKGEQASGSGNGNGNGKENEVVVGGLKQKLKEWKKRCK